MAKGKRDWASGLGSAVRLSWFLLKALLFISGCFLVLYGIWLYDPRPAYIGGGLILIFFYRPRPERRT